MENIAGQCFLDVRTVLHRYSMIFHRKTTRNPSNINEIHAPGWKITIGFPIGTQHGLAEDQKRGTMNHLDFGLHFAPGSLAAGNMLFGRQLETSTSGFIWFLPEVDFFITLKFENIDENEEIHAKSIHFH